MLPDDLWPTVVESEPRLGVSLDEWTVRMMAWHFGDETGSPFWLSRRDGLGFDPRTDVRCFDDLRLFGEFEKAALKQSCALDLLPRGFDGRPFRVVETGGSSGTPCRVLDVTRGEIDVRIYDAMLRARGLTKGSILSMTPSGPHAYGHFVQRLGAARSTAVFAIDFDPRWVKALASDPFQQMAYVDHLISQVRQILDTERCSLLFTTSKLLAVLATTLDQPLRDYGIEAVCTGGTHCTRAEADYLRQEHLVDVQWIDTYGNTLMGHALQGDRGNGDAHSYHLPPPLGVIEVVGSSGQPVAIGERGRVRITTLLEDLFIPGLFERDAAVRSGPHPAFPWPGVSEVGPADGEAGQAVEGVY